MRVLQRQPQSIEILTHASDTAVAFIDRNEFDIRDLHEMRALAAGRGARVEHTQAGPDLEQWRRQLCAGILHGEHSLLEPGELRHRLGCLDEDAARTHRARLDACITEALEQTVTLDLAHVGTQREGWSLVSGRENVTPVVRKLTLHALYPPGLIRPPRDRVTAHTRQQRLAFAQ